MTGYRADDLVGDNARDLIALQALLPVDDILAGRHWETGQSYAFA